MIIKNYFIIGCTPSGSQEVKFQLELETNIDSAITLYFCGWRERGVSYLDKGLLSHKALLLGDWYSGPVDRKRRWSDSHTAMWLVKKKIQRVDWYKGIIHSWFTFSHLRLLMTMKYRACSRVNIFCTLYLIIIIMTLAFK